MARSIAVGLCFKYRLQNVKMRKAPDVFSFQLKPPSSSRGTQIQTEIAGKSFWELRRDEDSLSLGRRRRHWQQQQQLKQRQRQQQHQPRLPTRVVGEKRGRCGSSSGSVAAVGPQKLWMRVRVWFWVWVWVRMWMLVTEWNQTKRRNVTHSQLNQNYTHIAIRIRTRIHIRFHFLVFVILHALVVLAHVNRIYIVLSPAEMLTK